LLPAGYFRFGDLKKVLSECISLRPAVVADGIDEIVADERWVEMLQLTRCVSRNLPTCSSICGASVTVLIGDQDVVHNHRPEAAVARACRHIPALFIVIPFRGGLKFVD
jgi:hypothetical protein